MIDLQWTDYINDKPHIIEISNPFGGGSSYHIYVDKFYQGIITRYADGLRANLNDRSILTKHHVDVIIRMIEEQTNKPM